MPPRKSQKSATANGEDLNQSGTAAPAPENEEVGLRNMQYIKRDTLKDNPLATVIPPGMTSQTSPVKNSGSNRMCSEPQTKVTVDAALKDELSRGRFLTDDLGDLMFRADISTDLARDVLAGLLDNGTLNVCRVVGEEKITCHTKRDKTDAVDNAYERALAHGCKSPGLEQAKTPSKHRNTEDASWQWTWTDFPKSPLKERALVDYLNNIVDTALRLPCVTKAKFKLRYRFAAPSDATHAFPLSYEPDKEDMRPDFVVLPIEAFEEKTPPKRGGFVTYEPKKEWFNFTTIRLSGECKNTDSASGVVQVQRYMRGMKRAQPWQRFVTAMAVTREIVSFMRGDGSGLERLQMCLEHGRSCLEFVRVLLGVVLCDDKVFGKSSHFAIVVEPKKARVAVEKSHPEPSVLPSTDTAPDVQFVASNSAPSEMSRRSSRINSRSSSSVQTSSPATLSSSYTSRSSQKRRQRDDDDEIMPPPAKKEIVEEVEYMVQVPTVIFAVFEYDGLLFCAASLRGRGTVVFVVHRKDSDVPRAKVALKISWQDISRKPQREEVLDILSRHERHENVLYPEKVNIEEDSTLRIIRAFTATEACDKLPVEDRVLEVQESELKRPIQYFWSVQDFVMGLCGALRGHDYLVSIGILHRDVSENNIVLGLRPDDPKGYIMDFDMAVPYKAQPPNKSIDLIEDAAVTAMFWPPLPKGKSQSSQRGPFKAERTGTTPYMSINVLNGMSHTEYDDVVSFFYVLLLFFVSYKQALPAHDLLKAGERGFTQIVGSGRPPHVTPWPEQFNAWSKGSDDAAHAKGAFFAHDQVLREVQRYSTVIGKRWANGALCTSIGDLIWTCLKLFLSQPPPTRVTHQTLIDALQKWLEKYPMPPRGCNSCPFNDAEGNQRV